MPTMKNRDTQGKNAAPITLHEAMGLPGKKRYTPNSVDYVFDNVKKGATKGKEAGRKAAIKTSAGHDVATRVNIPSAKAMSKSSRTQAKMRGK